MGLHALIAQKVNLHAAEFIPEPADDVTVAAG
jgi:hypothetical protein